jgi:O-antigen ligase
MRYVRANPFWLPCVLLLIEVVPSMQFFDESVRPVIRYPMLLAVCLPAIPLRWRGTMLVRGGFRLYLIYFAFALISVSYSLCPTYSLGRVMSSTLLFGGLYRAAESVKDEHDVRQILFGFWFASCLVLAILLASLFLLPGDITWDVPERWSEDTVVRFQGVLGQPNQVGAIALGTIASGVMLWRAAAKWRRVAIAASITLAIFFTAIADSRSAIVALAAGFFALTFDRYRWRAVAVSLLLLTLAIGGASLLSSNSLAYVNRGDVMTLTGRTDLWWFAIAKIKESPILGYGYEVEGEIYRDRYFPLREKLWDQGPYISLHSGYLARAAGLGVPALLFWLFFILRPMVKIVRGSPDYFRIRDAIFLGAIPVLVMNLDESAASDCRYSIGILLAVIWAIAERSRLLAQDEQHLEVSAKTKLVAASGYAS